MSANCFVFATVEMTCPLCHTLVPANTRHTCQKSDPWKDTPHPPGSREAAAAAQLKLEKAHPKPPGKSRRHRA